MPLIQLQFTVKVDGKDVAGYPLNLVYSVQETQEFSTRAQADGDGVFEVFHELPVQEVTTVEVFAVQATDKPIGVRVVGFETGVDCIRLLAKGGMLIWGTAIPASALEVNNPSVQTTLLHGFAGGH